LPIELLGLGRQYQDIDLSDKEAKLVTFLDPGPTDVDPNLHTYAYYRLADGTWKGADWTGQPQVEFCRDSEDVREVILVHSTTTRPAGAGGGDLVVKTQKPKLRLADKCDSSALFDATSASGSFNWNLTEQENLVACSDTRDIHWSSALAPGGAPAKLQVYYVDDHDRPVYSFSTPVNGVPLKANGTGVATRTCNMMPSPPGSSGTARCNVSVQVPEDLAIGSDGDLTTASTMALDWFWGFPGIQYDPTDGQGGNGGSCTYTGSNPPTIGDTTDSASLFVSSINDGTNLGEPIGTSTVSASSFGENSVTLTFSGSAADSFSSDLSSGNVSLDWGMTVTFQRR
jgi:hypothetical protein